MFKLSFVTISFILIFVNQSFFSQCTVLGNSLPTSYISNNSNKGEMFNIVATNTVTILCFDLNLILGSNGNYEIYYKVGSYVGSESNAAAWTLIGSNPSVPCVGFDVPSPMNIPINIVIPAGQTYGFYVTATSTAATTGIRYTNNSGYTNIASDANISINGGIGKSYPFGTNFNNRSFNGTVHYSVGNVLPVDFIHFNATIKDNSTQLEWSTQSENKNDFFTIEKTQDGQNWENIGTIDAVGNSTSLNQYDYIDESPRIGTTYYQLSQTDIDGVKTILDVQSVFYEPKIVNEQITLFPNPATSSLTIYGSEDELDGFTVYNSTGQDVTSKTNPLVSEGKIELDISTISSNFVLIKTNSGSTKVLKIN